MICIQFLYDGGLSALCNIKVRCHYHYVNQVLSHHKGICVQNKAQHLKDYVKCNCFGYFYICYNIYMTKGGKKDASKFHFCSNNSMLSTCTISETEIAEVRHMDFESLTSPDHLKSETSAYGYR